MTRRHIKPDPGREVKLKRAEQVKVESSFGNGISLECLCMWLYRVFATTETHPIVWQHPNADRLKMEK
jgi:hypothetical protein